MEKASAVFSDPRGIVCDSKSGDLFVTNYQGPMPIVKIVAGNAQSFVQSGMHLFNSPTGISIDSKRNLYVINQGGVSCLHDPFGVFYESFPAAGPTPIVKIDQQGRAQRIFIERTGKLSSPMSLALGQFDHLTHHNNFLVTTNSQDSPLVKV